MTKITIIGCGYVGTAIARYWERLGFSVTVTTTTPEKVKTLKSVSSKVAVVQGNDPISLESVIKNAEIVLLSVGAKGGNSYVETYLETAKTLVSVLEKVSSVKQLIYTSSYSVYGDRQGGEVDENSPVSPVTDQAKILIETEQIIQSAVNSSHRVCILRLGGIYGEERELIKIFGRVAGTVRPGNGKEVTNWIHLEDIVSAIEFARQQQLSGIYNLVDDAHITTGELFQRLFKKHNLPPITWDSSQKSLRPYNVTVSNQKIKDAGYSLIHPQMQF